MEHTVVLIPVDPEAAEAALNAVTGFQFAGWLYPPTSIGPNYAIMTALPA